jgi:hypothetical protein
MSREIYLVRRNVSHLKIKHNVAAFDHWALLLSNDGGKTGRVLQLILGSNGSEHDSYEDDEGTSWKADRKWCGKTIMSNEEIDRIGEQQTYLSTLARCQFPSSKGSHCEAPGLRLCG